MFDIAEHEWVDPAITETIVAKGKSKTLIIGINSKHSQIGIVERDAIAIAKHFYESLNQFERLQFINKIRDSEKTAICDGYSYKSLNLDKLNHIHHIGEIGEVKRND